MSDLDRARTLFGQGLERHAGGDLPGAEQLFRQANDLAPGRVSIMGNLSTVLIRQGKIPEARSWAQQALDLDGNNFEACMNLGACLEKEQQPAEALALFEKASALKPEAAEAWSNRGHALSAMKRHEEALAHYDKAVSLQASNAEAWTNRGNALNELGRYREALASHDKALAVQPKLAEAWYNRGNALSNLKRDELALTSYDEALHLQPGHADAHFNKGLTLLNRCDFAAGWGEYEWRWDSANFPSRRPDIDLPEWDGKKTGGGLLAWAEQGIGDEILYGSMLEEIASRAGRLTVTMDVRLVALFRRTLPQLRFLPRDQPIPPGMAEQQVAMGSIGRFLRRTDVQFPRDGKAWLQADPQRVEALRPRIAVPGKRLIGLSWRSQNVRVGGFKSLALADLLPLLSQPDLAFVDLQYGDTSDERRALWQSSGIDIHHLDDIDNFKDIDGLAALIDACDAVVTVSNVTTHLAGGLGKAAFQLTPYSRGKLWYWHDGEPRSRWYPSVRLFRQQADGNWAGALAALIAALQMHHPDG